MTRTPPDRPRLRDVAARAGVSIGTASNAFSRADAVSPELRARVLAAAQELGYGGPDPAARRLRTGEAGAIGLIFTDRLTFAFGDEASSQLLRGIAGGLEGTETGLLIVPTSPDRNQAAESVRRAAVDGFIVYSTPDGDPRVDAARERGLPIVTVDQPRGEPGALVGIDDRAAARDAAAHLRELGHRRVLVLSFVAAVGPGDELPFEVTAERLRGYREGLGDAWDEARVLSSRDQSARGARKIVGAALDERPRPTAILAMSDALALGALQAARDRRVSVPRRLSVVGFDGTPGAETSTPALTTVVQPQEEKGRLAAEWLTAAIRGDAPTKPRRRILPNELVDRGSTAPAPTS
ncbi:MAG: Transcriptional regulator [Solirubrobacterales bacterium]|nr:Transcriptional regulator [Solirubrobacterales bacterium]